MVEYIEREAAIKAIDDEVSLDGLYANIEAIPAADVCPERHGEWKGYTTSAFRGMDEFGDPIYRDVNVWVCSECCRKSVVKENFCPNCGAKMDGKDRAEIERLTSENDSLKSAKDKLRERLEGASSADNALIEFEFYFKQMQEDLKGFVSVLERVEDVEKKEKFRAAAEKYLNMVLVTIGREDNAE